jgi:hypothetical protein
MNLRQTAHYVKRASNAPADGKASDVMGPQHHSKPVTDEDKIMSRLHKKHRAMIDKIADPLERARAAIPANRRHAAEHRQAAEHAEQLLKQLDPKSQEARTLGASSHYNRNHEQTHRDAEQKNIATLGASQ